MTLSPMKSYTSSALMLLAGTVLVIATVLSFEHIGGYIPCKLCLGQRVPYYAAIPVAFLALIATRLSATDFIPRLLIAIVGLLMVYAMVLGIQHAGVEWGWWEGPGDCGAVEGGLALDTGSLLEQLQTKRPPSCNEAAGRFLGLSFAGWNVVVSFFLALYAGISVFKATGRA